MDNNCKSIELRGVWIATVYGIDWPKTKNNPKAQREEFIEILDTLKNLNFNAVFVQIRPSSDALYKSKINPYRVTTQGTDLSVLADNNIAKSRPEWVLSYENALFYDPQNPEVIKYIATTVYEIVKNYCVDGIHFDDYFYPYNYPLPEGEDREGDVASIRRESVTNMIELVYNVIKSVRPSVQFGVSPFGVWKNKSSDIKGSDTKNLESYYDAYMDSLTWIKEEILDYIAPQIYWTIENKNSPYEPLLNWWIDAVSGTNVRLYVGQNIGNIDIAKQIAEEIQINRSYDEVEGSIFFSMKNIEENTGNVVEQFRKVYNCKAITPSAWYY